MKIEIVRTLPQTTVKTPNDVGLYMYYGVIYAGQVGFIIRESYDCGKFCLVSPKRLTNHNSWPELESFDLASLVSTILCKDSNNKVYEFDKPSELFDWLAEQTRLLHHQ